MEWETKTGLLLRKKIEDYRYKNRMSQVFTWKNSLSIHTSTELFFNEIQKEYSYLHAIFQISTTNTY